MVSNPRMVRIVGRKAMKKFGYLLLLAALCLPLRQVSGQEKSQERAKSEERAKPPIPVKVQVVFSEYDGEKKISSMPYSLISLADEKSWSNYNTSLRTGVRIPI